MTEELSILPTVPDSNRWDDSYADRGTFTLTDYQDGHWHCSDCLSDRFVFGSTPWQVFCHGCHAEMADPVYS